MKTSKKNYKTCNDCWYEHHPNFHKTGVKHYPVSSPEDSSPMSGKITNSSKKTVAELSKIKLGGKRGLGKFALVDNEDFTYLNQWKWHLSTGGYALHTSHKINEKQITIAMHRLIMKTPKDLNVDHINHDTLDNRKMNLRNCNKSQNHFNSKPQKNGSGYKGVLKHGDKWQARIRVNNKQIYLGTFDNPIKAAIAQKQAAKKYHGEFAYEE